ncbi:DExH-box ATP-dependent RNA helicase DExH5, mitochondrial-like [Cucurbita pepo subsp. pepo]|uniref:DExH-box ATP-dependent RNA helicase DExH5, mitochondrial-like n=1 Tax=Cucurbita pepo subsp. pepo TaxID=3664 RepID=UPI000C9D273B|nr:DExH-box ATP-dependent RNA helicase DExH5, mitochondrial-like [Cucurbita pepo subsp. pepo]XP_023541030.1 DExH-box ATP-dependent RNA helicase DExH5, mitochondrial-like [Cucurbita pepo subsp. pepo]
MPYPHLLPSLQFSKPPKPSHSFPHFAMKDRSPSSNAAVYVPPHLRLRFVLTSSNHSPTVSAVHCKIRQAEAPAPPSLHAPSQELFDSAYRNRAPVESQDCNFEFSNQSGVSPAVNIDLWKRKLALLLRDKDMQEVVSREKKDRHDFEQLAALASSMGLFSHLYAKVAVFSKVPLPNYRFDLDDRRPLREVSLPPWLLRRVDEHLGEFLSQKSRFEGFQDISDYRSISSGGIATDEGLFEQPELQASSKAVMEQILRRRSLHLREQQHARQSSPEGREMLEFRKSLPAYKEKDAILTTISQNQVTIISGETGCGKTTQVPQFILESEVESLRGAGCSIVCTQPRRISAMSVSERVASERGEKLGESVGYKVRLEGIKGRETHLLFCTTGILLRRLLVDRNLKGITHVIVDEIHERGMNEDFLLIVLKDLLPRRPELRLILMSATLDAELFSSYFGGAQIIHIPGFAHPVRTHFLEDILEMTGYRLTPYNQIDDYGQEKTWKMSKQAPRKRKTQIASSVQETLMAADFKEYSLQTQESLSSWNPDCLGFNLIEYLLVRICESEIPGAILVFMTGWDDISSLKEKLQSHPLLGDPTRVLLLACHGSMASSEQRLIFIEPDKGMRKIVLATNIAETSITINDVVYVLDCGKAKETSYDALNNTSCLLPSWISKVSAQQRRGRAGRVQPGECYHLYPRCVFNAFAEYQLAEILRTPLQSLCLQIKSLKLGSISKFLSRALQSPEPLAVQNAIEYLKIIGAFDENENLTVLGRYLILLPMEPKLGKMLILGAILNCLDPILTIVAGLSVRDPFLMPLEKKDAAEAAKSQFSQDHSDHLAIIRAYRGWKEAERNFGGYDFCWKNFLSVQSMKAIDSLRKEFFSLLRDTGLVDGYLDSYNAWSLDEHLIRAVICYGLYPGVCSIVHNEKSFSLKTMEDGQVLLYSNSVNARESRIPYPWLVFNEKIKVNSIFLRDSTAISDSMLLLFGGNISKGDHDGHLKMLSGFLEFFMKPDVAEMYQKLRLKLEELIQKKLLNPKMDLHSHHELLSAVRLLISEDQCEGRFVFARQIFQQPSMASTTLAAAPTSVSRTESRPGGDNSKSQLQTLLTRAGYAAPTYKTMQLKNNQFRATVEFNGLQIMGQPCTNKKNAEKDAAAEALECLMGGTRLGHEYINQMSLMLKRNKKDHN